MLKQPDIFKSSIKVKMFELYVGAVYWLKSNKPAQNHFPFLKEVNVQAHLLILVV